MLYYGHENINNSVDSYYRSYHPWGRVVLFYKQHSCGDYYKHHLSIGALMVVAIANWQKVD